MSNNDNRPSLTYSPETIAGMSNDALQTSLNLAEMALAYADMRRSVRFFEIAETVDALGVELHTREYRAEVIARRQPMLELVGAI